ncbi:hypothetical protein B0H10DRAFT_2080106, partial [Mycena sp. CBHHK59/15]
MLCLASAVILVLRLLSAAPHPCCRCRASVSLVLCVMATFCPSPLHPRCVALAACGIFPVVHCHALSAACGYFYSKPNSTIYMTNLWFPVSSVETNCVWVIWR